MYVRPFPDVRAGKTTISTRGGARPQWAANGRELFYIGEGNVLMRVPVQTSGGAFVSGTPVPAFGTRGAVDGLLAYASGSEGRLLVIKESSSTAAATWPIVVVLNWLQELTRLLPPR